MPKTILITGAKGQLGNEIRLLADSFKNAKLIFTDIDELDITNREAVHDFFKDNKPDICINCAAYTAVDLAEDEPDKAFLINEKAVENLAEGCSDHNSLFYHISTDFVFNGNSWLPYKEDDQPDPISVYGKSKLAGEQKAVEINPKTVVIRTSWLYSRFGNNFVKTMLRLGSTRDEIGVIFDQIGTPTNAKDLAMTLSTMAEKDFEIDGENKVTHFSNEGVASWYDFTHEIFSKKGLKTSIKPLRTEEFPTKAVRPRYSILDKSKIKSSMPINIPHWKDSLQECLLVL